MHFTSFRNPWFCKTVALYTPYRRLTLHLTINQISALSVRCTSPVLQSSFKMWYCKSIALYKTYRLTVDVTIKSTSIKRSIRVGFCKVKSKVLKYAVWSLFFSVTRRSRSDVSESLSQSALALTWLMWPWWVMIPIEDFTDVSLAIEDTDEDDEDDE